MAVGCTPGDRHQIASSGQEALGKAYEASSVAVRSALSAAAKVDLGSSKVDLQSARDQAASVLDKLEGLPMNVGTVKDQIDRLRLEIERIDRAIATQKLKEKWQAALMRANQGKELAADRVVKVRASLLKASEDFKALDLQLNEAQKAYEAISGKIDALYGPQ